MAYRVAVEKGAKGKAVKTKQIDLCYFCGAIVDEEFARLSKERLGYVLCAGCMSKLVLVICRAGARSI